MKFLSSIFTVLLVVIITGISCNTSPGTSKTEKIQDLIDEREKEWTLVWADEFEGDTLDQEKWSHQLGTGSDEGLQGWGNNELQYYTTRPENIFLEDGYLHIVAKEEHFEEMNYTSSRIRTINKGDWMYGRIEIRAKLPQGQGIWPAIWMLPTDNIFGGWPKSGEIDIMEMIGNEPETIHGTVHYGPDWPENQYTGTPYSLDTGIFADTFHTFAIEWEQDKLTWFVDDKKFFSVTPENLTPHVFPFNERFHLILNLAVGGNWPGVPNDSTEFPQVLTVDYVRVYQN